MGICPTEDPIPTAAVAAAVVVGVGGVFETGVAVGPAAVAFGGISYFCI